MITHKQKRRVILRIDFSTVLLGVCGRKVSLYVKRNLRFAGKLKTLQQTKGIYIYSVLGLLEKTNKSFLKKRFLLVKENNP